MFITTKVPDVNRSVPAGEILTNGDTVDVRLDAGILKAFKHVVGGTKCNGFATFDTTDPILQLFPQLLSQFQSNGDPFAAANTLPLGRMILIQEGDGMADTDRVVAGSYNNGDPLTPNGDGTIRKAVSGEIVVAEARESRIIVSGDRLKISFDCVGVHKL